MKKGLMILAILVAIIIAQGCGMVDGLSQTCKGSDIEMGCNAVLGYRNNGQDDTVSAQDRRITELENQLQAQSVVTINQINSLYQRVQNLYLQDSFSQSQLDYLQVQIAALQVQQNSIMTQLTVLSTGERIVEFVDPCGPGPGFNEILIRTSGGRLVAYFEQGSNRFLSSIGPGSYRTTDSQACNFNVNSQMQVCDTLGCH